jgi:hypothetical protein
MFDTYRRDWAATHVSRAPLNLAATWFAVVTSCWNFKLIAGTMMRSSANCFIPKDHCPVSWQDVRQPPLAAMAHRRWSWRLRSRMLTA